MQVTDILAQLGGAQSIAGQLGISESQAQAGMAALIPTILGGFQKKAAGAGTEGLAGMLEGLAGGASGVSAGGAAAALAGDVTQGNQLLGEIFGSKDVSRAVAQNAATSTGLDPAVLKKMLPIVAMLAAGYMARSGGGGAAKTAASGAAGGLLGSVLGGLMGGGKSGSAGGGLASMLDANGDGNPLDDILRMMKK